MYKLILIFLFSHQAIALESPVKMSKNRFYISKKIHQVFGDKSKNLLEKYVLSKPNIFGGSCELYGVDKRFIKTSCVGRLHESKIDLSLPYSKAQSSLMDHLCKGLINNRDTYRSLIKKIETSTKEKIFLSVNRLFNGSSYLSKTEIKFLEQIFTSSSFEDTAKKYSLYTCMDDKWYTF